MHNLPVTLRLTAAVLLALGTLPTIAAEKSASELTLPDRFAWAPVTAEVRALDEAGFWQDFGDPTLSSLVERALSANHDLRIAVARYDSANALLRGAGFDRFPIVTARADASDGRASADQAPGLTRAQRDSDSYSVGAQLSWEIDLFGRVRNGVNARRADAQATALDLQALQVSIVAEVARDYIGLRGLQERLRVAQENADSQSGTLRLVEAGVSAGRGTEFDAARARSQLATTRSRLPALEADIAATLHHLAVLVGQPPEALLVELGLPVALPALPAGIDPGTPGDLLRRRPDIAAAEARLQSAAARIGVARSDFFPRFTLGALFGAQSGSSDTLFERDGETRLVALGIDWSFLDVGRVRARLAAARAEAEGERARYEQTILRALEETETALVRFDHARSEDAELASAAVDSAKAAQLARIRYEHGAADLFEVLDAERVNLQAEVRAALGRIHSFTQLGAVYKALAGGWPARLPERVATASR